MRVVPRNGEEAIPDHMVPRPQFFSKRSEIPSIVEKMSMTALMRMSTSWDNYDVSKHEFSFEFED